MGEISRLVSMAAAAVLVLAGAGVAHAQVKPGVGDRWVYEARDADRPRNKYQIVVEVQEVTPSSIRDVFRPDEGRQVTQTHRAGAYLASVAPGIADFSPYLRAFQELRAGESWPAVDFKQLWECGVGLILCSPSARIVGKEKVTVPAGTYDAWKIVVALNPRMGASASGSGELTYWLADEVGRIVKFQSRVRFLVGGHYAWPQPDMDMELISYTRSGTK